MKPLPDFRSPDFLLSHMREIMDFYYPICINKDDGLTFRLCSCASRLPDGGPCRSPVTNRL